MNLTNTWNADIGYTQSDEITLIYFPKKHKSNQEQFQEIPFKGRVVKLATVLAGFASARFNHHLRKLFSCVVDKKELNKELDITVHFEGKQYTMLPDKVYNYNKGCTKRMLNNVAYLDARVFNVPNDMEALNNVYWRSAYDCVRNSVSKASTVFYSFKENQNKNTGQKKEMLKQKGYDWDKSHPVSRYGVFIKSEKYQKMVEFYTKGGQKKKEIATRTRCIFFTVLLDLSSDLKKDKSIDLLKRKYFESDLQQYFIGASTNQSNAASQSNDDNNNNN